MIYYIHRKDVATRKAKAMSKTTITTADFDSLYNAIPTEKIVKLEKAAAKTDTHPYWNLLEKTAKKIGTGAVKMEGNWYPVINGKVERTYCYQFSSAAVQVAVWGKGEISNEWRTITSL